MSKSKREPVVITASSMSSLFTCARKYYMSYVVGWRRREASDALRFGTAFHKGIECWLNGKPMEECILEAFGTAKEDTDGGFAADPAEAQKLISLLVGYFAKWENQRDEMSVRPEREFCVRFPFLRGFVVCGKIDGVVTFPDGHTGIIEHKTTSEDISPASTYWETINRDQVALYKAALEKDGIEVGEVIYDVIRKPTIKCGVNEEPKDYGGRLLNDCTGEQVGDNPRSKDYKRGADFYFQRKRIPLLANDMETLAHRLAVAKELLKKYTKLSKDFDAAGIPSMEAWPKCGSPMVCRACQFHGVCHLADLPPTEWYKGRAHEELDIVKTI